MIGKNKTKQKQKKNKTKKTKKKNSIITSKRKEKKNGCGEDLVEDRSCARSHAKRRLNPCATATKTISYFKFSQPVFRKIRKTKNFHKPHIEIINQGIMLTAACRRPGRNVAR